MLKVLPSNISNLIAAGEVVQRPASVVKELVENSVDAGASAVTVIVEDAGKTLIQVIDDGTGMSPEDAKLCFQRHATSKISEAVDLEKIQTYGFRGEALPSIASVAEVTLRTRKRGEPTGSETVFLPSGFSLQEEAAMPEGTNIAVRNLFFTIPARRKFLKSDNSEFRQIVSEFSRVALCRPDLNMRLVHNGKDIFNLKKANTLKQRILEIEGRDLAKELIDVETETPIVKISGFIGSPTDARKSQGNQYFFVNGRYFKSPYLHKAVMKAYDKLIPEGTYPSYYIFFEVQPANVDVNIHPAKTEVKFENEMEIFEFLSATVRESLGRNTIMPVIDFEHDTLPDMAFFDNNRTSGHEPFFRTGRTTYTESMISAALPPVERQTPFRSAGQASGKAEPYPLAGASEAIFDEVAMPVPGLIQISGKYVVTPMRSGLMVVDVKRARERILYEDFLKKLDNSQPITHQVLFPCTVLLSQEKYAILMEEPARLSALGFDIVSSESGLVEVKGIPDGFMADDESIKMAIDDLVASFVDAGTTAMHKAAYRENMAASLARSAASCKFARMTTEEARVLVDTLFACAEPEVTPCGLKTMFIITEEEIERKL